MVWFGWNWFWRRGCGSQRNMRVPPKGSHMDPHERVGFVIGREGSMLNPRVFPIAHLIPTFTKAQKQTFKNPLRQDVGISSDGNRGAMFVVCNAFASLRPSPQKGLKNSVAHACGTLILEQGSLGSFTFCLGITHIFRSLPLLSQQWPQ